METDLGSMYVIEYSAAEDAFHIGTIREMLTANLQTLSRRTPKDYVPLALASTHRKASELALELRAQVDQLTESERARKRQEVIDSFGSPLDFNDFASWPRRT